MQRLHFLRWLALAIAVLSLQCLESLSDDCTKTLTCGNEPHATLDAQCKWRFPDGGVWEGGPHLTPEKRWVWPDGRASESFNCEPVIDRQLPDAGDGGVGGVEGDCNDPNIGCDAPLVCEPISGRCVSCLDNSQCVGVTDPSLGSLPICDQSIHACVACLRNGDCPMATGQCKTDGSDPTRNQCVECENNSHCPLAEPVCDAATGECTARCNAMGQCLDPKPICNLAAGLCVECLDNNSCTGSTPHCNTTTKQCVPCVGVGATTGACTGTQVCNALNQCVECVSETQCGTTEKPLCDTDRNKCVGCFNSAQCTSPTASRCNTAESVCTACTSDVQCEPDLPFCALGRCVACKDNSQCGGDRCDPDTGNCVKCLTNGDCGNENSARCDTTTHECTSCNRDDQCGSRFGIRQLCDNGSCVQCKDNVECALDSQKSRCDTGSGLCAGCRVDSDCNAIDGQPACVGGNGNNGRCVECTDNGDCTGNPAGPACKLSAGGSPDPVNTCVQCTVDADCPNPAAARCSNNVCVACADNASCAHLSGLGVCDTSATSPVCVQCTGDQRSACSNGANVCNSLTKQCTSELVGARGRCETCVSDAHCAGGEATGATARRCALQVLDTVEVGYFCFPVAQADTCSQAPFAGLSNLSTIDGDAAALCLLRRTTCEGLVDFGQQSCTASADCGRDGLADGVCDTNLSLCSIPCALGIDCLTGDNLNCAGNMCDIQF